MGIAPLNPSYALENFVLSNPIPSPLRKPAVPFSFSHINNQQSIILVKDLSQPIIPCRYGFIGSNQPS